MSFAIIHNHAILLKDSVRMDAYRRAIEAVVKHGDVVFDIGCGTGMLSFLALKAGAGHVHAIDADPDAISLAKILAKHNGLGGKITFHKGTAAGFRPPRRADVVVSEIFGNLALNENLLPVMMDARRRLLRDGGVLIPGRVKVHIAPVAHDAWSDTNGFLRNVAGFDLLPDTPDIQLGIPSVVISAGELLAREQAIADINLGKARSGNVSRALRFRAERDGILSGFAGWFDAHLMRGISFSTSPASPPTHWKQGFLPLRRPVPVRRGQIITFSIRILPSHGGLESIVDYAFEVE